MITRRDFIVTAAATASSPSSVNAKTSDRLRLPLRALPRVRTLPAKLTSGGKLLLVSDGPTAPKKLIKAEALERAFGSGTDLVLQQPDHWCMIEEGWFADEDLYEPTELDDPAYLTWQANYRPENEAHDLLYDLFREKMTWPFGSHIAERGLSLAEHPCTPRLATAKLDSAEDLPRLASAVASRTSWVHVETDVFP